MSFRLFGWETVRGLRRHLSSFLLCTEVAFHIISDFFSCPDILIAAEMSGRSLSALPYIITGLTRQQFVCEINRAQEKRHIFGMLPLYRCLPDSSVVNPSAKLYLSCSFCSPSASIWAESDCRFYSSDHETSSGLRLQSHIWSALGLVLWRQE